MLPSYLSEFGWDSSGGGESCAAPECVSELGQSLYALRASFIVARWGVVRASWFFYGNSAADRKGEGVRGAKYGSLKACAVAHGAAWCAISIAILGVHPIWARVIAAKRPQTKGCPAVTECPRSKPGAAAPHRRAA